jgi:uncharacterized protein (TIGR00661 family)
MKIFYAIQGTGNGHVSRAVQLYPYLKKYGDVDFFLSGSNAQLNLDIPIKYQSKGVSLFYKPTGGLDYKKIAKSLSLSVLNEAKQLPLNQYDLIINDFEFITSLSCSLQKKKSIQFGHQASFQSKLTPRAKVFSPIGNLVLEKMVKSTNYLGLHFSSYDKNIYNPIIKDEIIQANPSDEGHITVYLPQYSMGYLTPFLHQQKGTHFEVFTKEVVQITNSKNITFYPIHNQVFTSSLIRCHGIITAGGFETPAEAMYLKKKILSIPILNHYEQACNAEAMRAMGVMVLKNMDEEFSAYFKKWLHDINKVHFQLTHHTKDIVQELISKAPYN